MLTYVKYAPLFSPSRRLASARYKSVYSGAGRWRHLLAINPFTPAQEGAGGICVVAEYLQIHLRLEEN